MEKSGTHRLAGVAWPPKTKTDISNVQSQIKKQLAGICLDLVVGKAFLEERSSELVDQP